MTFEEMCLDTRIMRAIAEMGFEQPSPIQAQSIPIAVEGKDMIGQARTGTGKTASFGIPMLQRINPKDKNLQAIVLCPTRELAIQSANEIRKLAKFLHGIKVLPIYGGQEISRWCTDRDWYTGTSDGSFAPSYIKTTNGRYCGFG